MRLHVLIHPTSQISLSQFPALFVIDAALGLDTFQVTGDEVFAFAFIQSDISTVMLSRVRNDERQLHRDSSGSEDRNRDEV